MPGPARSAVTTISSSAWGGGSDAAAAGVADRARAKLSVAANRMRRSLPRFPILRFYLGHEPERTPFGIFEYREPLLGAVGVLVDHVRRVDEVHTEGFQPCVRRGNVAHAQIEYRLRRSLFLLAQHQPCAAAIEKGEFAERVQMRQPQHMAIPLLGFLDVAHGSCD